MASLLTEFKEFLLKGNLVATAVALVIALVFTALVTAFVADIVTPIIAMIFGKPDFSSLSFTINGSHFLYGEFINAAITFITVAAVGLLLRGQALLRTRAALDQGGHLGQGLPRMHDERSGAGQARSSAVHRGHHLTAVAIARPRRPARR